MNSSTKCESPTSTFREAKLKTKERGVILSSQVPRRCLMALVALAIFVSVWLTPVSAATSDFAWSLQDKTTGDNLFVNFATGDYLFFNGKKQSYLAGKGKLTVSDCQIELQDSGANRKRPDRSVTVLFNTCENIVTATCESFASAESYSITDAEIADNRLVPYAADAETSTVRFNPYCVEDDASGVTISIGGGYLFNDPWKGIFLEGDEEDHLIRNGCKLYLIDNGLDPKRPDRHVYIEINTCTGKASGYVWIAAQARTYILNDSNMADSHCQSN